MWLFHLHISQLRCQEECHTATLAEFHAQVRRNLCTLKSVVIINAGPLTTGYETTTTVIVVTTSVIIIARVSESV